MLNLPLLDLVQERVFIFQMMKYLIIFLVISTINIPANMEKKIDKEILSIFELDSYSKEVIVIDKTVQASLTLPFNEDNFFKIFSDENMIGYFYYGQAPTKVDVFDYIVVFDEDLILKKIKVLAYREDYGGEICSKRWLKQFNELSIEDSISYKDEIKGISGATISAKSMTITINRLLKSLAIIQKNKQI